LLGQRGFQHLGVDFDPRNGRRNRGGLDVVKPDRGCSDQHQFTRDFLLGDASIDHIGGRNIDRRILTREMNPKLAVAVGRDFKTLDRDALDTLDAGFDEDGVRAGHHPQHFEAQ